MFCVLSLKSLLSHKSLPQSQFAVQAISVPIKVCYSTTFGTMPADPNVEPIMDEALLRLDPRVRAEYDLASQSVPHLVETETPKSKFLRREGNNPWKAAHRLAMYWKYRKECMAEERWLRPMAATSNGCLGEAAIEMLRRGLFYYSINPSTGPVLVMDGARSHSCVPQVSGRVFFYLCSLLDDAQVQTHGFQLVYAVTSTDTESHVDPKLAEYIKHGLPVRVCGFAVVQNYEPEKQALVEYLATRRQLEVQTHFGASSCPIIASTKSQNDLLRLVDQAGIPSQALPVSCGGQSEPTVLCDWISQRFTIESASNSASSSLTSKKRQVSRKSSSHGSVSPKRKRQRIVAYKKRSGDTEILPAPTTHRERTAARIVSREHTWKPYEAPKCTDGRVSIDEMLREVREAIAQCHSHSVPNSGPNRDPCPVKYQRQTSLNQTISSENEISSSLSDCTPLEVEITDHRKLADDLSVLMPLELPTLAHQTSDTCLTVMGSFGDLSPGNGENWEIGRLET